MEKQTSDYWYNKIRETEDLVIYDPDGWDRKNYQFSFYEEKITKEEFEERVLGSTCLFNMNSKK